MRSIFAYLALFVLALALAVAAGVVAGPDVPVPQGTEDDSLIASGSRTPSQRTPSQAVETVPLDPPAPPAQQAETEPADAPLGEPEAPSTPAVAPTGAARPPAGAGAPAQLTERGPRSRWMHIPVQGVLPEDLMDTFPEKRGERPHEALDIHAPRGTPVVAAEGGVVQKIWESEPGGHTVYVLGAGGRFRYYYAHLEGYRAGLAEGEPVEPGAVVGYVGDSGNAVPGDTHLHFAVLRVDDPEDWSGGTPVNPLPYLLRKRPLPR